jgi:Uncharacterized conserved protein
MRNDRLTRLAMRVVEDAAARAEGGAVERTWGHRLALEYLVRIGIADARQADSFWRNLAMEWERAEFDHQARYIQTTQMMGSVHNWRGKLGYTPLNPIEFGRLSRPYMPDLEIDAGTQQHPCMCNRYQPGERDTIRQFFNARLFREANEGPATVHPKEPGWVVRRVEGDHVLEQMTWGFPVHLRGKSGQPLKAKPVNNARFDKLSGFWKRWADIPAQRCLIPASRYAEAVGPAGKMTTTWMSVRGSPLFAWAGLWRESDEWGACYAGVMTDNAPELLNIHDRSPVILRPQDWDTWLTAPLPDLARFDAPWPAEDTIIDRTNILWKDGRAAPPNPQASLSLGKGD